MSPKGTTYITLGTGGFYYRRNITQSDGDSLRVPEPQTHSPAPAEEIKTADVEQLLKSSKSELVESLNKRAQMFNPANVIFVIAAICAVIGAVLIVSATSTSTPRTLPELSAFSEPSRRTNHADEYALLIAHYGQPSSVDTTQAGTVPLRTATYESAHLAVKFVPAGCVDSYMYYEAHKTDVPVKKVIKRHHGPSTTLEQSSPPCALPTDKASTIVAYRDTNSDTAVDSETAEHDLAYMNTKSAVAPVVRVADGTHVRNQGQKADSQSTRIGYNEETLRSEQQRIADSEAYSRRSIEHGVGVLIVASLLLIPSFIIHKKNREKRTTRLEYELTGKAGAHQGVLDGTLEQLTATKVIWRVDSQSAISDWKRNAGAAYNVQRDRANVRRAVPPLVECNVIPMCIDLGKTRLFFLPDQVLYWQRGVFASIEYKDLSVQAGSTQFIEEQIQTSDSQQVGSTWRYVRKDGGPDRRFNNNRQLPIMLYGVLSIVSSSGVNLLLQTSNASTASSFADSFRSFLVGRDQLLLGGSEHASRAEQKRKVRDFYPTNLEKAMRVLGLPLNATSEQVAVAYRDLAQMYHPDKVAGLGPELKRLAEEKMKEINAAHYLAKKHLRTS